MYAKMKTHKDWIGLIHNEFREEDGEWDWIREPEGFTLISNI